MPRPYHLGQRQSAVAATRQRIITAAREVLMAPDGYARFTIEHVAQQADVARKTVYYQFGSKIGLLEALCDTLATAGGMDQLANAFRQSDPAAAMTTYIQVFGHFWNADRLTTRHLRGLASLDPDFAQVIQARDERRREGVRVLLTRLNGTLAPDALDEMVNVIYTLLSFETFDTLAGPTRDLEEITPVVVRLVFAVAPFLK